MTEIVPLAETALLPEVPALGSTGSESSQEILTGVSQSIRGGAITIGNFDGVHRGHVELLGEVRSLATSLGGPAVAVVLDPHPASILHPETAPVRLSWIQRRAELMDALGIDALVVCETTPRFLKMTASQFFDSLVTGCLNAKAIVEGPNFFFGRDRGGDVDVLRKLCRANDVELRIVHPTVVDDHMISSTRIRRQLELGQVDEAARLLGKPHRIRGTVGRGAGRGHQIGFPTANLSEIDVVIPAPGVYGGIAMLPEAGGKERGGNAPSGPHCFRAAIHIGPNPTFESDGDAKVEIHLLDFSGDLYERTLLVDFITRVRDIARFDSADRLIEQLNQDMQTICSEIGPPGDASVG